MPNDLTTNYFEEPTFIFLIRTREFFFSLKINLFSNIRKYIKCEINLFICKQIP